MFKFLEPVKLAYTQGAAILQSFLSLNNSIQFKFKNPKGIRLRHGEFSLQHSPEPLEGFAEFDKDKKYESLELGFDSF